MGVLYYQFCKKTSDEFVNKYIKKKDEMKKGRMNKIIGLGLISGFVLLGLTPRLFAKQSWKITYL
jgi:hypothetical protein